MPLCESPKPIILLDIYYLTGRDLYILIGDTMFQVHRYFLTRDSSTIHCKLEAAELDKDAPTGATQTVKAITTSLHSRSVLGRVIVESLTKSFN